MTGHALAYEGAPHDEQGHRLGSYGVGGEGRAKCACGELSEVLTSGYKRKEWYRTHRDEAVNEEGTR